MVIMLQIGKLFAQHAHVMVIDQGDRAHNIAVGRFPGFLHKFVADQIAKSFGTVGIPALLNEPVELAQQG